MRTIEILNHEIEFWLKDIETNTERFEPLEEGTTDYIEEQLKEGYLSGELVESVFDKEGNILECIGHWNIKKPKELKVYVLEYESDDEKILTDEEFMQAAEAAGDVYSIQDFQEAFNDGEISDVLYIRFL